MFLKEDVHINFSTKKTFLFRYRIPSNSQFFSLFSLPHLLHPTTYLPFFTFWLLFLTMFFFSTYSENLHWSSYMRVSTDRTYLLPIPYFLCCWHILTSSTYKSILTFRNILRNLYQLRQITLSLFLNSLIFLWMT